MRGCVHRLLVLMLLGWQLPSAVVAETLQQAWDEGLMVDQRLESTRWQASAAQRGLYAAEAERWLSIDSSARYYTLDHPVALNAALPMGSTSLEFLQREGLMAGIHIKQPLYTFGRIQSGIDAAGADVTAALSVQAKSELDVLLQISVVYTNVLRQRHQVDVSRRAVESLASHASDLKTRVEEGAGILNDQLAAEVALANARQDLLRNQARLDVARAAYNRSLGRPFDTPVHAEELTEPMGQYDVDQLMARALARRPEIAELSAHVRALRSRANEVRAGYKPQLSVQGGVDYIENRNFVDETYSSIQLMGQWNMFDTGRKRHSATRLEQRAEGLLRERNDVESQIRLQVLDAWRTMETTRQRVAVSRSALRGAEENLRVAKTRYDGGVGTNTEVLDAERLRTETYGNFYHSMYDAVEGLMRLSRACGDFSLAAADIQHVEPTVHAPVPTPR